jgi:hypothetical protein
MLGLPALLHALGVLTKQAAYSPTPADFSLNMLDAVVSQSSLAASAASSDSRSPLLERLQAAAQRRDAVLAAASGISAPKSSSTFRALSEWPGYQPVSSEEFAERLHRRTRGLLKHLKPSRYVIAGGCALGMLIEDDAVYQRLFGQSDIDLFPVEATDVLWALRLVLKVIYALRQVRPLACMLLWPC